MSGIVLLNQVCGLDYYKDGKNISKYIFMICSEIPELVHTVHCLPCHSIWINLQILRFSSCGVYFEISSKVHG